MFEIILNGYNIWSQMSVKTMGFWMYIPFCLLSVKISFLFCLYLREAFLFQFRASFSAASEAATNLRRRPPAPAHES